MSCRLSGDQASACTPVLCPSSLCNSRPVPASQRRTVLSCPPEAIVFPSGDQARPEIHPTWVHTRSSSPVATSQIRIVLSEPPEATCVLSGDQASVTIGPECVGLKLRSNRSDAGSHSSTWLLSVP